MAFEADALKADGIDYAPVPPRYRTPYFSHIMGGYAAGYYAYIWSEVLDANTVQWIKQHGGLTRENGDRMRQYVLGAGGQIEAGKLFPSFAGYEAEDRAVAGEAWTGGRAEGRRFRAAQHHRRCRRQGTAAKNSK